VAYERLLHQGYHDALTGLPNRLLLADRLRQALARAERNHLQVAFLSIDLDRFKNINDEFGHMLGDDVLRAVSNIFLRHLRKVDVVCRYGGEEFAVILPATQGGSAAAVADKLRRAVASAQFACVSFPVTVSIGVSEFPANGITRDDIVRAADAALYQAKESGRNRVCLASSNYGSERAAAPNA